MPVWTCRHGIAGGPPWQWLGSFRASIEIAIEIGIAIGMAIGIDTT
jgi:hypothetical protein